MNHDDHDYERGLTHLRSRSEGVYRERRQEVFATVRSLFFAVSGVLLTVGCLSLAQTTPRYWYHLLILGGGGVSACASGILHEQERANKHRTLAHAIHTHYPLKPTPTSTYVQEPQQTHAVPEPPTPSPSLIAPSQSLVAPSYVPSEAPRRPRKVCLPLAEMIGGQPRSTIIVGQSGAGKGRLVKHALLVLKREHPEVTVWVVDPKQDESEGHQWESADRVSTVHLPPFASTEEVEEFKTTTTEFLEEFKQVTGPKLIILDEAMAVKEATGKWFTSLMAGFNSLCSMGRSRRQWGWVISQSPNAGDLGLSGGTRNVYTRVLVVHSEDRGLLANNSTFFTGTPNTDMWDCVSGRVGYISTSNQWGSLPNYE